MLNPKVLLGLAAALGVGAVALTSHAAPAGGGGQGYPQKTPSGGSGPGAFPPELVAKMQDALLSGDPQKMRQVAAEVEAAGYKPQADSLRAAAATVEATIKGTPPVQPPPGVVQTPPLISLPPAVAANAGGGGNDVAKSLAGRLALHLSSVAKGSEDKSLVTAFQNQEKGRGFYVGNLDGLYGPKSALALAKDYGIVPPKPYYWPKNSMAASKKAYNQALLAIGAQDAPRAEEWAQAANV